VIERAEKALSGMAIAMLTALVGACSGGPGESEFVAACLKEGEIGANKALRGEMGVKSDEFCKCTAKVARATLSADAQRAMILDMQGKPGEARAITSKMSESEQMAFMKGGIEVFGKCAGGGR